MPNTSFAIGILCHRTSPSYVDILWGFLVVPTYITLLASLFLIFVIRFKPICV
ncbi:MAG: hypothetical protein ACFFFH_15920 [Candidatus Thorarchaeota archaeon]